MNNNKPTDSQLTEIIESADGVLSALAGTNEDVHRDNSTKMCRLWDDLNDTYAPPEVVKAMAHELQEYRKAASDPVGAPDAWLWKKKTGYITAGVNRPMYEPLHSEAIPLYAIPQTLTNAERAELQEYRKASSEPVAYIFKHPFGKLFWALSDESNKGHRDVFPVYAAPPLQAVTVPDGWAMVPKVLSAENGAKASLIGEFVETKFFSCPECFGDDDCESCDGSGRIKVDVPVCWTTIKAIWGKGIECFAAAPQPAPIAQPSDNQGKVGGHG